MKVDFSKPLLWLENPPVPEPPIDSDIPSPFSWNKTKIISMAEITNWAIAMTSFIILKCLVISSFS